MSNCNECLLSPTCKRPFKYHSETRYKEEQCQDFDQRSEPTSKEEYVPRPDTKEGVSMLVRRDCAICAHHSGCYRRKVQNTCDDFKLQFTTPVDRVLGKASLTHFSPCFKCSEYTTGNCILCGYFQALNPRFIYRKVT